MSNNLKNIEISQPLIYALFEEHIDDLKKSKANHDKALALELRWTHDDEFREIAMKAISQGAVFSTLAGTAVNTEDFQSELVNLGPIEDEMGNRLRGDIFAYGVRSVIETIGIKKATAMKIGERIQAFEAIG